MKRVAYALAALILMGLMAFFALRQGPVTSTLKAASSPAQEASVQVYFSPQGGCTQAIIDQLDQARSEILIQAYSFTSRPIAKAILDAARRGVSIAAVLDKSQRSERYTAATFLANAGLPVLIDDAHRIAHNKIIIIDKSVLITGSFNFSKAAEYDNAENLLVITGNQPLIDKYLANFEAHRAHSEAYQR